MKILLIELLTIFLLHNSVAEENKVEITCSNSLLEDFLDYFSKRQQQNATVNFYLAEKENSDNLKIGNNNWSALKSFNPEKKTYLVVHGYFSNSKKPWIVELKKKILNLNEANLILVDWVKSSHRLNYVNAARSTQAVTSNIIKFLKELKTEVEKVYKSSKGIWNHLYFIGHSLGAHISGQTGYLLKQKSDFYKVDRITGLDPAHPCFTHADHSLKLDTNDADFVDVIHTQTVSGDLVTAFGLKESLGHIDFYVNGAAFQPECDRTLMILDDYICSHKLACQFFIDSIDNSKTNDCKFTGYRWEKTHSDALRILHEIKDGSAVCAECPEMGYNTPKVNTIGDFIVFTSAEKPRCKIGDEDIPKIEKVLRSLKT